jgi:hypothetical protein
VLSILTRWVLLDTEPLPESLSFPDLLSKTVEIIGPTATISLPPHSHLNEVKLYVHALIQNAQLTAVSILPIRENAQIGQHSK